MTVAVGCRLCMALSCGQPTADETNEAVRANRTGKALTHRDSNSLMQTHRESQDRAPDRQAEWSQCERGSDTYKTMWLHALAIRAAAVAAAAVPEQSPPAAQL